MGSPGRNLNIPEDLRAWHEAGLHYLLAPPCDSDPEDFSDSPSSASSGASSSAVSGPSRSTDSEGGARARQDSEGEAPASTERQTPEGESPSKEACDDYRSWQEPWKSLWLKTPHEPKIVWTYYDLGMHMGGRPDAEAGKLLQWLIQYFRWPKGTIAFWPMSELRGEQCVPNPEMFWRGLDQLAVRTVAVFGPRVLSHIAPDAPPGAHAVKVEDVTCLRLPSLGELAPMLPHERLLALDPLKQLRF